MELFNAFKKSEDMTLAEQSRLISEQLCQLSDISPERFARLTIPQQLRIFAVIAKAAVAMPDFEGSDPLAPRADMAYVDLDALVPLPIARIRSGEAFYLVQHPQSLPAEKFLLLLRKQTDNPHMSEEDQWAFVAEKIELLSGMPTADFFQLNTLQRWRLFKLLAVLDAHDPEPALAPLPEEKLPDPPNVQSN